MSGTADDLAGTFNVVDGASGDFSTGDAIATAKTQNKTNCELKKLELEKAFLRLKLTVFIMNLSRYHLAKIN